MILPAPEQLVAHGLRAGLGPEERRWIVAVSGGADSVFLAHCARMAAPAWGAHLVLAHLNHHLRGADSAADELFVRQLARDWGLPILSADCPPGRGNLQDGARRARRGVLLQWAGPGGVVWLGHNAWDQGETVLAGLLKGKAPYGVRPLRGRQGPWLRPLLGLGGGEIRGRLRELGLAWREDASNHTDRYERGVLRNGWLAPLRARFGDEVDQLLNRMADNLLQVQLRHEQDLAEDLDKLDLQPNASGWSLERLPFVPYHGSASAEGVRALGRRVGIWRRDPPRATLEGWARFLAEGRSGARCPLAAGAWLELGRQRAWIVVRRVAPQVRWLSPGQSIRLFDNEFTWGPAPADHQELWVPPAGCAGVVLRGWLPGDRLVRGPAMRKRLAEWMGELGFTPTQKRLQPVAQVGGVIQWVPGLGRAWEATPGGQEHPQPIWVRTCRSPLTR